MRHSVPQWWDEHKSQVYDEVHTHKSHSALS